jgi:hypothetical protein
MAQILGVNHSKDYMRKTILLLALTIAAFQPAISKAEDRNDRRRHNDDRYYDRHHKDRHEWNDREDRAWRMYWDQRHKPYRDWDRVSQRDRDRYWNWRHNHSDSILKIEIR